MFTGTYQLAQCVSYLAERYTEDGDLKMHNLAEDNTVLKCEVQSRHINCKIYKCYVQYQPNTTGYGGIKLYVCDCPNGLRTVGCCWHVATIIYFLSHARYLSRIIRPAEILSKLFEVQKIDPVITEDSDEEVWVIYVKYSELYLYSELCVFWYSNNPYEYIFFQK